MTDTDTIVPRDDERLPPLPPPWERLLTLQTAAIVVFVAFALAAILIALFTIAFPPDRSATVAGILNWLFVAIGMSLVFAWLSSANVQMLGRGFRHLLSIHRAAVACFVISGAATVGILIYVALAIMAAAEVEHGLYLLAAIELLLKLTAVSAIIVLITLRRTSAMVIPASATPEEAATLVSQQDDRGRLEFGSLAFAFGLVVIAALVVPTDDLMRISAMMFGGDKKVEDYLPQRPVVRIEDDISDQIDTAVQNAPAMLNLTRNLSEVERNTFSNAIQAEITSVIYNIVSDRVKRVGAWPLFIDICEDKEDALISINSNNKLIAEHISYLASEGLIDFPYGDIQSLDITQYGSQIIFKTAEVVCKTSGEAVLAVQNAPDDSASVPDGTPDTAQSERVLRKIPDEIVIPLSMQPQSVRLEVPPGNYLVSLNALDQIDPFLRIYDDQGMFFGENDDGGRGVFDSAVSIRVTDGQVYVAAASTVDGRSGSAILRIERDVRVENLPAAEMVRDQPALAISDSVEIPPSGAVFQFTASADGMHVVTVAPNGGRTADLKGELFRLTTNGYESIAYDDDSGRDGFPRLTVPLTAGETYYLVLQHFGRYGATSTTASIEVAPEESATASEAQSDVQTEGDLPADSEDPEAPAEPPPPVDCDATGSAGSQ